MRSKRRQATGLKGDKHPRKPIWEVSSDRVSKANVWLVFSVRKCIVFKRVIKWLIGLTWIKTIDRYSQQNQRRLLDYWLTFETFQLCKTNVNTYCWKGPSALQPCLQLIGLLGQCWKGLSALVASFWAAAYWQPASERFQATKNLKLNYFAEIVFKDDFDVTIDNNGKNY